MHDFLSTRAARLCGIISTGLMLVGLLVPQAFANESEGNQQRFFDPLPPDVIAQFTNGEKPGKFAAFAGAEQGDFSVQVGQRPAPDFLFATITGANLNGMPVIDFQIVDEFGLGIEGLVQGENVRFSFTVSKLVSGRNGETNNWATYMRETDEGIPNVAAGTYSDGTFEDLGNGNYRFTFDDPLEAISGVLFQPRLTHRVGMEVRDAEVFGQAQETSDATFDIQPSTGNTTGIATRAIVAQESCTSCHGTEEFAFHGGPRQSVDYCVTCHQKNRRDGGTLNTLDFRVMIHKIHYGVNLTENYEFCGFGCENFGSPPDNFNHVVFPQSTKNCITCHDPENPATPQAVNIDSRATAQVCASCHDTLAFDNNGLTNANRNHIGLAQPNSTCEACHSPNGLLQGNLAYHEIPSQLIAQTIQYNILDVSNTAEGQSPIVTFEVINPIDGSRYDLMMAPEFNSDPTSVNMTFAWPTSDFANVGNAAGTELAGSIGARAASIRIAGSDGPPAWVNDNGDGTYTLDTGLASDPIVIPATNPPLGSGQVGIEGHPAADFDGDGFYTDDVPVTNVVQAFAINDATATPRREIVSLAKCQTCHNVNDGLALHGGNRTDNVQHCVECHNPNATDINRRPDDPDGTANGISMATLDMLEDRPVNFTYLIHGIHGASVRSEGLVIYGFGSNAHDYSDASFPRSPSDCQACHQGDSYTLPLGGDRLATTFNTGATNIAGGFAPSRAVAEDPTDDNNVSAIATACTSCHNSETAMEHISVRGESGISFGNGWLMNPDPINDPDTQAFIDSSPAENCSFCHSEGGFVPVSEVHGINN